jgi:hypothetical protein
VRGFTTTMPRLWARAPKGERAYGKVPRNRGKNTTLIAAMTLEGALDSDGIPPRNPRGDYQSNSM